MNNGTNGLERNRREAAMQEPSFDIYMQIILRGKWWILGIFAVVFLSTALYTFRSKPVYQATTSVLIDTKGQQSSSLMFDVTGIGGEKKIKNELEILKSISLSGIVAQLLLDKKFVDDAKTEPLLIVRGPQDSLVQIPYATIAQVSDRLQSAVDFEPIRESDVIKISAKSNNAREAALLANTYAEAYYNRNLLASRTRSRAVREFLDDQLEARKKTLATAEDTLQQYMKKSGIVSLDDESKKVIDQLAQLEAQRDAQDIEIQSLGKTLSSYQEEFAKVEPNVSKVMGEANDPYIRLLQEQIATLEVQRDVTVAQNPAAAGMSIYSDKLKEIDKQIDALRLKLQGRTNEYLKSLLPGISSASGATGRASDPSVYLSGIKQKVIELKIEQQALVVKKKALADVIKQYERQFEQIPQKSLEFARLQRNRLSNEKLFLLVEEKFNESAIKEKSEFGYVDIIDPAIVPRTPVSPRTNLNLMLGVILGLMLGIGFVFTRESVDARVRTPEDLRKRGWSPLTAVAMMNQELKAIAKGAKGSTDGRRLETHLITHSNPLSSTAESFRRLRTNLQFTQVDKPVQTILITSPNPGEGKSTIVSNLAIAFAQAGKKVLLVETDMRKPALHRQFDLNREPGFSEMLLDKATEGEVIQKTIVDRLDVICCGEVPPNPSELLGSDRMKEVIERLKKQYDIILFDSPPVLAVTDPSVLGTIVDGVIIVVSSGKTNIESIERSMELVEGVGGRMLGLVLNNFDLRLAYGGNYKYYRSRYYTYGYGTKYGQGNGEGSKKEKTESKK